MTWQPSLPTPPPQDRRATAALVFSPSLPAGAWRSGSGEAEAEGAERWRGRGGGGAEEERCDTRGIDGWLLLAANKAADGRLFCWQAYLKEE